MPSIIKSAIKGCTGTVFILEYQLILEEGDSGYSPECACTPHTYIFLLSHNIIVSLLHQNIMYNLLFSLWNNVLSGTHSKIIYDDLVTINLLTILFSGTMS